MALMATLSTIGDIEGPLRNCAEAKCNVITIAEELLHCWTSAPEKTKEMDELFKANGVSFTGSGFIDGACCEMTMVMASLMHKIDKLEGGLQYNVDHYGQVLAIAHGVGLTDDEFAAGPGQSDPKSYPKSYVYNSNEWFASALGLTVVATKESKTATKAKTELVSTAIGRAIPVGQCTGMMVTATTKEGVMIVGNQVGKCYEEGEDDWCAWGFEGNPSGVKFSMTAPPTPAITNTTMISRIPQILDAPAGFVTSDKLPIAKYEHFENKS